MKKKERGREGAKARSRRAQLLEGANNSAEEEKKKRKSRERRRRDLLVRDRGCILCDLPLMMMSVEPLVTAVVGN